MTTGFPTLRITAEGFVPQGAFAEAQAAFLRPDARTVAELAARLRAKNAGIVAHYYMDAELQGVLAACGALAPPAGWPHIAIADSLKMADTAVTMAAAGVTTVIVLGVDFMSENVRAVLDSAGYAHVEVLRAAEADIGCSLAESAEKQAYEDWLREASRVPRSLHVVYINTSLSTKARAHALVPTITCTSSNVVQTILQAAAQIPDLHVWYGPDTYMGHNLRTMFAQFLGLPDAEIRRIHPAHDRTSLAGVLERFHTFEHGNCVVHHLFGADVVARVRAEHAGAFHTAHLEVPGEMFELAVEASHAGRGVVGSTSDILGFIRKKVAERGEPGTLSFVLGTESGMITSIVNAVRAELAKKPGVDVEIVFPVASEAVTAGGPGDAFVALPGVPAAEGCSTAGGCATCPFMKMNSLDALFDVLDGVGERELVGFRPKAYAARVGGRTVAEAGGEPILHMRHFQKTGALPDALVADVIGRRSGSIP